VPCRLVTSLDADHQEHVAAARVGEPLQVLREVAGELLGDTPCVFARVCFVAANTRRRLPPTMNDITTGWDETLTIADGRTRADVTARATQAFDWANECRARYTSILDLTKRAGAVSQAAAWASILEHMDAEGADVFSRDEYNAVKTPLRDRLLAPLHAPGNFVRSWKFLMSSRPVAWYEPPREARS
jgi:hypothetical protein